jgi:hypothetical protein
MRLAAAVFAALLAAAGVHAAPAEDQQTTEEQLQSELSEWRQRIDSLGGSDVTASLEQAWADAKASLEKLKQSAGPTYDIARGHVEQAIAEIRSQWAEVTDGQGNEERKQ